MSDNFDAPPPGFGDQPQDFGGNVPQHAGAPAEFVPRLIAYVIDWAIGIPFYLPFIVLLFLGSAIGGGFGGLIVGISFLAGLVGFLAYIYMIVMNLATTGQTPGKRSQGIKVVLDSGQPLGAGNAVIRQLLLGVMNSLCGIPLGSLWMLFDGDKKTLYDKVLNMSVVQAPAGSIMPIFPDGKPF